MSADAAAGSAPSREVLRQLKIKTGAVKRLIREHELDLHDVEKQRTRIAELRAKEGVDGADIRKQNEVLEEALQMIPFTEGRLKKAAEELNGIVQAEEKAGNKAPELDDAKKAVLEAHAIVPLLGM
ncbi:hypothetical protein H4R21_002517 [Coemansia helicoidea]|uniref:Uncharacterized protein n=1 Tax=Coemansia helicoidea TaxID=1286919 RepID=A0ACC1L632_9FUNG|nr:hypothetical protein H4R21_002517 [Coemansia helicoidea]